MSLFNRTKTASEPTDDSPLDPIQDEPIETSAEIDPAADLPAVDVPELLSAEELDTLYFEDGSARYQLDDGTPCDAAGNPIPESRPVPQAVAAVEPEAPAEVVPERPRPNFRSPFEGSNLSTEDQEYLSEQVDGKTLEILRKDTLDLINKAILADRQQQVMARHLGINPEFQDDVLNRMAAVQSAVPHELRGTKIGNDAAFVMAAIQEAGETGSVIEVIQRWGNRALQAAPSTPTAPAVPVQPRKQTPFMAPSARTTVPRGAPEAVRSNRPTKTIGALTQDAISVIQRERNTDRNGR